jgi:5-formyltetrahydrofolate cyclo-ligase
MGQESVTELKASARRRALGYARPGDIVTSELAVWLRNQGFSTVAGFVPLPTEVDVMPTLLALASQGVKIALPRIHGEDLDFIVTDVGTSAAYTISALGTQEPVSGEVVSLSDCDAALIPALACDLSGARLGRGKGFYDRALRKISVRIPRIAVVHDSQLWPAGEIPREDHDLEVTGIATPTQLVVF